jgi:hypothetical protein
MNTLYVGRGEQEMAALSQHPSHFRDDAQMRVKMLENLGHDDQVKLVVTVGQLLVKIDAVVDRDFRGKRQIVLPYVVVFAKAAAPASVPMRRQLPQELAVPATQIEDVESWISGQPRNRLHYGAQDVGLEHFPIR